MHIVYRKIIAIGILVILLIAPTISYSIATISPTPVAKTTTQAKTSTMPITPAKTSVNKTATSKPKNKAGQAGFFQIASKAFKSTKSQSYAVYIFLTAMTGVIIAYLWYTPLFGRKRRPRELAWAKAVQLKPPRGYDFMTYVVDKAERSIEKDYYIKISENLYMSTNLSKLSFLYVPGNAEIYMCREGKTMVPCGTAYRQGLLTLLVDPELATAHDLATATGLISIDDRELDKLLSELYKKGEKKVQQIPITPETKIGFTFDIKNMIKGYLRILMSADEMMMYFLNTANKAESIERFLKTAERLQEARLSWLNKVAYFILALAIALAMLMIVK